MAGRRLRTVFFGSSDFSVPSLRRMLAEHNVLAVITQPDRPAGRGLKITATPVAALAREAGYDVLTPQRLDADFIAHIERLRPELLATASYGKILPSRLLELGGLTALNVHPSLLPRYRGATPIQAALRDGCDTTGVTIFWMTERMDAGDIALARILSIDSSEDYGTLHNRLADSGAQALAEAAALLSEGRLPRVPQREEDATYCKPLSKDDLRLRLDAPARRAVDQIRSLSPKPGGWMPFDGMRLKVLKAEVVDTPTTGSSPSSPKGALPGAVIAADADGPVIATAPGAIRLLRVIPEGKPQMSGADFAKTWIARS